MDFLYFSCLVFALPLCVSVYICEFIYVSCSLTLWYPGSGVVLNCFNSRSLHPFLLLKTTKLSDL